MSNPGKRDFLPGVEKAYGHICGDHVQVGVRNTSVILKYCRQFLTGIEEELPDDVLAHASRILILVSMYSKELGQDTRDAEMIYIGLLLNTSNDRLLHEFLVFGELLVRLLKGVRSRGPQVLEDGRIEMPFAGFEVTDLLPAKVNVAVNSLARLYSLISMWCNVSTLFRSEGKGVKQLRFSLCVNVSPFKYLGTLVAMFQFGQDADAKDIAAMCECLVGVGRTTGIPTWATVGLFEGITGYLERCLQRRDSGEDTESDSESDRLLVLRRIRRALAVIAGRDSGESFKADVNELIFRTISKLLSEYVIPHKEVLRRDCASAVAMEMKDKGNGDGGEEGIGPETRDVVRMAPHLLWYLRDCVLLDLSLMPSLTFLASCCVNIPTEHVCACMISQAVIVSPTLCATLLARTGKHARNASSTSSGSMIVDLTVGGNEDKEVARGNAPSSVKSTKKRKQADIESRGVPPHYGFSSLSSSLRETDSLRSAVRSTEAPTLLADLLSVCTAASLMDSSGRANVTSSRGYEGRVMVIMAMEAQVAAKGRVESGELGEKETSVADIDLECADPCSLSSLYLNLCEGALGFTSQGHSPVAMSAGNSSSSSSSRARTSQRGSASLEMQSKHKSASAISAHGQTSGGSTSAPASSSSPRRQTPDEHPLAVDSVVMSLTRLAWNSACGGMGRQFLFSRAGDGLGTNTFAALARKAATISLSMHLVTSSSDAGATINARLSQYNLEVHHALALYEEPEDLLDRWAMSQELTAVPFLLASFPVLVTSNTSSSRSLVQSTEIAGVAQASASYLSMQLLLAANTVQIKHSVGCLSNHPSRDRSASRQLKCLSTVIAEAFCMAAKICKDTKKGALSSGVMNNVAHLLSAAITVITHAFQDNYEALKECTPACIALKKLLEPHRSHDAMSQEPSARLSLFRLVRLSSVWREQGCGNETAPLSSSVPDAAEDIDAIFSAQNLCSIIGPEVTSLFSVIREHLDHASKSNWDWDPRAEIGEPLHLPLNADGGTCVVVDTDTMKPVDNAAEKEGSCSSSVDAGHAEMATNLNEVAHLDALCLFRTLVSISSMSFEPVLNALSGRHSFTNSSFVDLLDQLGTVGEQVDAMCESLTERTAYKNHAKASRVIMLQAVCMLACSYNRGLVGEYSVREPSDTETGMFTGTIQPAGRFSRALMASQPSTQSTPSRPKPLPAIKDLPNVDLISISAFARFCQHSAITNPVAAVWALRHIVLAWAGPPNGGEDEEQNEQNRGRVALEELSELARCQILRYIMVSNVALTVEHIVVPLLLRKSEDKHGERIASLVLSQLCARLIAYKSLETVEDVGGGGEREIEDMMGYSADFIDYASGLIIAGIVTSRDVGAVRGAKRKLIENQDSFGTLGHMTNLLDGQSTVLYHLLISSRVQQTEERDLVRGGFDTFLKECCDKLQVNLETPSTAPTQGHEANPSSGSSPLKGTTIQKTLLPLIWDLGAFDGTRRDRAMKALRVFCTLVSAGKLSVGSDDGGGGSRGGRGSSSNRGGSSGGSNGTGKGVSDKLGDNVSSVLPDHFLYIMSRLIQQQQPTVNQKVQSVHCLSEIVRLLRQPDLAKFLPKIISSMDSVLSSSSGKVRAAGVELTSVLCARLQLDTLCENLSSLVVALYPSLKFVASEGNGFDAATTVNSGIGGEFEAMDDLSRLGQVPSKPESDSGLYDDNYIPSLYAEDLQTGLSCDMLCVFETAYEKEVSVDADGRARKAAVDILHSLFVSRRKDIGDAAIQTVAVIPDLPELKAVQKIHAQATKTLTIDLTVALLGLMLNHESAHVRCLGLERLIQVIRDNKKHIYLALSRLSRQEASAQHDSENFVVLMLKDLLLLAAKETEQRVLLACAECLGELGAIDPARVNLVLPAVMKKRSSKPLSFPPSSSNGQGQSEKLHDLNLAPWELRPTEMSFVLLETHLVPSLKGQAHMVISDKTGYAIQTMLRLIADFEVPDVGHSKGVKVAVPNRIREMLAERAILDVTEPFWYTRYRIQGQPPPIKTPIYYPGNSFNYWCAAWVRMLISHSAGVASQIFDTCKGIYRHRSDLSQFVLPHVVVNYILHKSTSEGASGALHSAHADIVWEICCVLRGVGDITGFKEVDDMIPVLEEFTKCIAVVERSEGAPSATAGTVAVRSRGSSTITSSSSASSSSLSGGGGDHMHIQAVFTLLDSLARWTSRGLVRKTRTEKSSVERRPDGGSVPQTTLLSGLLEEVRGGRVGKSASSETRGKAPASRQRASTSSSSSDSTHLSRVVQSLVDSIPLKLLTFAALRIKAFARALRYFELHARSASHAHGTSALSPRSQRASRGGADGDVSRLYDGSNYSLPLLSSAELDLLMTIYSKLEDPDAIQGVQMLRQHGGHSLSPWHRILELEQTDNWLGALLEYGLISDELPTGNTVKIDALDNVTNAASSTVYGSSGGPIAKRRRRVTSHNQGAADSMDVDEGEDEDLVGREDGNADANDTVEAGNVAGAVVTEGELTDAAHLHDMAQVDRGRLRCLIELGHLDAATDLSQGVAQRLPMLEMTLLPLGLEASWRLNRWDSLDSLLSQVDSVQASYEVERGSRGAFAPSSRYMHPSSSVSPPAHTPILFAQSQGVSAGGSIVAHAASTPGLIMSDTPYVIPTLPEDTFSVNLGRLFLHLSRGDTSRFAEGMRRSRLHTMVSLSAASMESYDRAYPLLTQLHILSELERGPQLMREAAAERQTSAPTGAPAALLEKWRWNERLQFMTSSQRQRSMSMAVRRSLFGLAKLESQIQANWMHSSEAMRRLGQSDAARIALRNAEQHGLSREDALLNECRILKESGQIHKALTMLEPKELDVLSQDLKTKVDNVNKALNRGSREANGASKLPSYLSTVDKRTKFAEKLLLATQLMVKSKTKHGATIIDRFKLVTVLRPKWDVAHFELARYCEDLYHDAKIKEKEDRAAAVAAGVAQPSSSKQSSSRNSSTVSHFDEKDEPRSFMYIHTAIQNYIRCVNCSIGSALIVRALPRMLSLWFSFTAASFEEIYGNVYTSQSSSSSSNNSAGGGGSSKGGLSRSSSSAATVKSASHKNEMYQHLAKVLSDAQGRVGGTIGRAVTNTTSATWYQCMPQLVSRIGHRHHDTREKIKMILERVLTALPQQSIWHLACLLQSLIPDSRNAGNELVKGAITTLQSTQPGNAAMLRQCHHLFINLIELAGYQHGDRKMKWKWNREVDFKRFLVPLQTLLSGVNPSTFTPSESVPDSSASEGPGMMYINNLSEDVDVATSKAKPKTIYVSTTCGKTIKFLCKQEKNGDLRKDNRMMEVNHTVNRLLSENADGRRRNLRLRTYAVVCLNEECGILEWVNNTSCIRHLITESHTLWPQDRAPVGGKQFFEEVMRLQEEHKNNIEALVENYQRVVLDQYVPCFHRWFLSSFPDPTAWLDARAIFTRSCAVWSTVGHVVGLGDRHTENILIDTTNGECVHVDFDCLFDKGLSLQRPEIVPFRLTPNMVDAMGLTGVEGTYRRTMEVTMSLLRENKDTLMSVLEPFLRDPTVAWSRSGRAQRSDAANQGSTSKVTALTENEDAKDALDKIGGRLSGVYNIIHPQTKRILQAYIKRQDSAPQRGLGAQSDEALPLSIQGQVARMIDEARSEENLAQMYIGWQPWA